jgi:two-component system, NarL family, nitrate/nitrite response regulator NarL
MPTQMQLEKARLSRQTAKSTTPPAATIVCDRTDRISAPGNRSALRGFDSSTIKYKADVKNQGKPAGLDTITIALVDEHPLYRDGVVQTLARSDAFEVIAEGSSKEHAIRIARDHRPAIMLLDVNISGNGVAAAAEINRLDPSIKLVFLTASDADSDVFEALQAGGSGYVLKGIGGSELTQMLFAVQRGETVVSPGLAGRLLATRTSGAKSPYAMHAGLTVREDEIMVRVTEGLTNKEVARVLGLTEKTVKHYMTNIMQKLQVRNRVEAAIAHKSIAKMPAMKPT